ncbi:MAG: hypothetical protein NT019_01395 [Candidatus Adlerbacteria bacterium]|nr:hypothetical protein [Candidatus Adlerbacteria bacterium]
MLSKFLHSSKLKIALRIATAFVLLVVVFSPALAVLGTPAVAHAQGAGAPPASTSFCNSVDTCIGSIVYIFTVSWTSGLVYVGAYVFNFGVQLGLNSTSYALDFLSQGWAMVRDIANLVFVFILIYIAYTIIVEAETSGTMKTLAMVVTMALLINFSFFITRIVIDAGNILAIQFYNAIDVRDPNNPKIAATRASPLAGGNPLIKDLSAGIMNAVQVQNLLSDKSFQNFTNQQTGFSGFLATVGIQILVYTAVAIMFALIAFVFFSVGIQFLIRIITLWFVIIFAPLAFAAKALPHVKYAKEGYVIWQKHLIESTFYPAIFLFMFLIITLFLKELAGTGGVIPSIFYTALGGKGFEAIILIIAGVGVRVGLITIMMFAALKFSNSFSSHTSLAGQNIASWAGGKAAQMGAGTSAWAARNTAGRAANALARSQTMRDFAANSVFGRPTMAALKGVAGASMDVRGVSGLKSVLGKVGIDAGKAGGKGGIAKQFADRAKTVEANAKDMNSTAAEKEKAEREFAKLKKNHKGGEAGFETQKKSLELAELMNKELFKQASSPEEKNKAAADLKAIQIQLGPYLEGGKKKIERLDNARLGRYEKRIGEDSLGNLGFARDIPILGRAVGPSLGSIEGALKVRKMAKGKSDVEEAIDAMKKLIPTPPPVVTPPIVGSPLTKAAIRQDAQRPGGLGTAANTEITDSPIFREIASRLRETNRLEKAQLTEEQEQTRLAREGKKTLSSIQTQKSRESTQQQTIVEPQKNPTRPQTPVDKSRAGTGFVTNSNGLAPVQNERPTINRADVPAMRSTLERIRRTGPTKPPTPKDIPKA